MADFASIVKNPITLQVISFKCTHGLYVEPVDFRSDLCLFLFN
jgi:hypothetical protein